MEKKKYLIIYKITNKINKKHYVGSCADLSKRKYRHNKNAIEKRFGKYSKLYPEILKYGFETFQFEILEKCKLDERKERETYWIKKLKSYKNGYNCTIYGSGGISYWKGKNRSLKTKKKISKTLTGSKLSNKTKIKIGLSNKNLWEKQEHRRKQSLGLKKMWKKRKANHV